LFVWDLWWWGEFITIKNKAERMKKKKGEILNDQLGHQGDEKLQERLR